MSYLEMIRAPIADMQKGIISMWFRDAMKGPPAPTYEWPSGTWSPGTSSMVPPNTPDIVGPAEVYYWNAYGVPIGTAVFGNLLWGAAACYMPSPPPFALNGIRTLMTFGDPDQPYNYYPWVHDDPEIIPAAILAPTQGFVTSRMPPPYGATQIKQIGGVPLPNDGLFKVRNLKLAKSPTPKSNMVPQSFIGVTDDGCLIICLQTNTNASYQGCAFQLDEITPLMASPSFLYIPPAPPYSYTQIGFPFPDGYWYQIGPEWWNGYEFAYKDISNQIMGAGPECFIIGGPFGFVPDFASGPRVDGAGWHHVLFSFDISGSVTSVQTAVPFDISGVVGEQEGPVNVTTTCKAWLAVDDVNYTGLSLQHRFVWPDGFSSAQLPGMGASPVLSWGPVTTYGRTAFNPPLGPNDILPRNVWMHGFKGLPRDGTFGAYDSVSGVVAQGDPANAWVPTGAFNSFNFIGGLWPLYGNGVAPGPWIPQMVPPAPTTPDPKTFSLPTYSCSGFNIPVRGHPIGIPGSTHHIKHQTGVEMAEVQIWANKTLDTAKLDNRRLFIDADGKPVKPKVAEKVLGKPDILLHGSSNWKKGLNTGYASVYPDGLNTPNPHGQFAPVAKIEKFKPEPQLNK